MRIFNGIDEVETAVGEHLGYSAWFPVTQDRIDKFADATEDHQWIHVDPERAAQSVRRHHRPRLSDSFVVAGARRSGDACRRNLHDRELRKQQGAIPRTGQGRFFGAAGAEILSFERTAKGATIVVRYTIEIEGAGKPALVADTVRLLVS